MIRCNAADCGKVAPNELQWRLLLGFDIHALYSLFSGELDAFDCPSCGGKATIHPSLAAVFLVEDAFVLLDRGVDPEPVAREALTALVDALGIVLPATRASDLASFKAFAAEKVKATARHYPYKQLNPAEPDENLRNWRSLQGEVITALMAGGYGGIPNFGVDAGHLDGERWSREQTIELMRDLVIHLATDWSFRLSSLTQEAALEELLIRLVDSFGAVGFVGDRLLEGLNAIWKVVDEHDADRSIRFHFLAYDASVHLLLGREHPRAWVWAQHYLVMRYAVHANAAEASGDRLRLSRWRVERTISYEHAWNAAAALLGQILTRTDREIAVAEIERVHAAVDDLSRSGLFEAVLTRGFAITSAEHPNRGKDTEHDSSPEALAETISSVAKQNGISIAASIGFWRPSWIDDPDAVACLYDALEPHVRDDLKERAGLMTWFGERMKLLGAPGMALVRIGRDPAPWENELSNHEKRRLWTERSNALRLVGDRRQALDVAQATLELTLEDPDSPADHRATAWGNYGILLRESGHFDEAVSALVKALELTPDGGRWHPLQSLATTYLQMGRLADAVPVLARARETAGGQDVGQVRVNLLFAEVAARMVLGEHTRAQELLRDCPSPEAMPDGALIGYSTVLELLALNHGEAESHRPIATAVAARLVSWIGELEAVGNLLQAENACYAAAMLSQTFELEDAKALWARNAELSRNLNQSPRARTMIEIAVAAITEDPEWFATVVGLIPTAIAREAGGVSLSSATLDLLSPLDEPFERLAGVVVEQRLGPTAIQIVADLRRNAHRKAVLTAETAQPELARPIEVAALMQSDDAPFLVVEWCDLPEGLLGLVTELVPGHDCGPEFFRAKFNFDFLGEAARVGARLDNWHAGRAGQPFETAHWSLICDELRTIVGDRLPDGGHVVVIDHADLTGLPYHIALGPRWTVSYATDWSAIKAAIAVGRSIPSRPKTGVIHAPRSNETRAVRSALDSSAEHMRQLAAANGLSCEVAAPGSADASAFRHLLEQTDVLKVLCHAQISREDSQIVLLVDHNGQAPPGYSFGTTLETTRGHRFGREELADQKKAPKIVFLGACSAGAVSMGGLDERTSFASILAGAGTNAVVAPRWKIDAELALPILDNAISRFLDGESLINAVSFAAQNAAARGVPPWQAHAFVVEGAWA